ncbi:MAG TPA: hypothetical protein VF541_13725 [Longimicrobium sp.]|jgi:hypothetical protein
MDGKLYLSLDDLRVTSFETAPGANSVSDGGGQSWPDVCTCINICQPTEDIYCSGGCPPDNTVSAVDQPAY